MPSRSGGLIRPHSKRLAMLYRLLDSAVVLFALVTAAFLYGVDMDAHYWLAGLLAVLGFQVAGEMTHIYTSWRMYSLRQELSELALACIAVGVFLVLVAFFSKTSVDYSRVTMVLWWTLAFSCLALQRVGIRALLRMSRATGRNVRTFAVAGTGDWARRVAERVHAADTLGLRPVGYFDDRGPGRQQQGPVLPVAGNFKALVQLARDGGVDFIYVAMPLSNAKRIMDLIHALSDTTVSVFFVPDFFVFDLLHARWAEIDGMPMVSVFDTPFLGVDGSLKRIEDVLVAAIALVVTAPVLAAIAAGVKLSSPGPVLFRQRRYGLSGKVVEVWKFRSMRVTEDGEHVPQARRGDPRVTPFGAFIRKTSLDELPQFFNVLQGHMSVVGPRPHAVAHNEQYRKLVPGYMLRHKVKPGITGWAQVSGWRGETDTVEKMQKRVEHDMHYIRNWSLMLDVKIVALTVVRGFRQPGAY